MNLNFCEVLVFYKSNKKSKKIIVKIGFFFFNKFALQNGQTALHLALQRSHIDIALLLITKGCELNVQDKVSFFSSLSYLSFSLKFFIYFDFFHFFS